MRSCSDLPAGDGTYAARQYGKRCATRSEKPGRQLTRSGRQNYVANWPYMPVTRSSPVESQVSFADSCTTLRYTVPIWITRNWNCRQQPTPWSRDTVVSARLSAASTTRRLSSCASEHTPDCTPALPAMATKTHRISDFLPRLQSGEIPFRERRRTNRRCTRPDCQLRIRRRPEGTDSARNRPSEPHPSPHTPGDHRSR